MYIYGLYLSIALFIYIYIFFFFLLFSFVSGSFISIPTLDAFAQRLLDLAFADSTHRNMKSHVSVYTKFCRSVSCSPFPIQTPFLMRYVAYLTLSGRAYGTIINHLSSLKHFNQLLGFGKVWDSYYRFQLVLRGAKRYLGVAPTRKHPSTPELLLQVYPLFTLDTPLHAAMWALFLVAFFTFLRKSNLVPDAPNCISSKVPLRSDLVFTSQGATLHIRASKTIQYQQHSLSIPLPRIPGSPLCPVTALRHHLRRNSGPSHAPLFSVISPTPQRLFPLTYRHFCAFLSKTISALGLVPAHYSSHSFRRGGASFAFKCNVPAQLIQRQGDWQGVS